MISTSVPAREVIEAMNAEISAVLPRYRVLLIDLHSTFMFGGDRFGPEQDFAATYASFGGHALSPAEVGLHVRAAHALMNARYADPRFEDDFPSVADALEAVAPDLAADERDRLERTFARHESATAFVATCWERSGRVSRHSGSMHRLRRRTGRRIRP